mmetsp:Transcript_854/g.1776  ORF Transcript_854/g.1776 Transcript_854/m.1776 type:complete len:520 (+) Transcript_854:93-1652(+)|eukprot:CAMPEP_0197188820 /NCGR_PEP_ID=MMETSP1423-20130617/18569_1 /TAXON_ID=476441 /ORGANISM="Pseudo-nitzschia heimii, Strain UNC1101" /LENGTH=519 /DNA_ID=CAMNT_0042640773 /DNA_START=33 /DNA_END=1592 /DNA_ORIENTATION=+
MRMIKKHLQLLLVVWGAPLLTLVPAFQNPPNSLSKPATTKTISTSLNNVPEPLAEEDTWQAFLDEETTGLVYYFDTATGESRWEPPTSTFPQVRLPRKKQRLADSLRKQYRETRQEMIDAEQSDDERKNEIDIGSIFSSVNSVLEQDSESKKEDSVVDDLQTKQDQSSGGWFDNLFNEGASEEVVEDPMTLQDRIDEQQVPAKKLLDGFFGSGLGSTAEDVISQNPAAKNDRVEEENKKGLLDSLGTPFFTSITDRVENQDQGSIFTATPEPINIKIEIGSHILPHPAKVRWGGEDATFVKGRTFGVFDGVSGAEKLDGVPLYSRTLANEMKKQCGTNGETVQDMTTYLTSAASYADGAATGASTAVVASIGQNGFLQALNVGDSCCMVIRDGKVTAKTREISHYWECPYQLSEDSPDQPKDGTKLNVELISGDLVIMGSDGVFDNVNDDTLLDLVSESAVVKPTPLAKKICDVSRKVSLDKNAVTPYSKQAQRRGDADYRDGLGGKVDDVSCIVVLCK